jgi:putative transposase
MGRPLRIQACDLHYHLIVRCNNGAFHFETNEDFDLYLQTLRLFKNKHQFRLFNYELMNSHVHLFLKPSKTIPLHKTMLMINWTYARNYNKRKKRKGHFWLDRYKSLPVQTDSHALALMRYINRNAVRAGIVKKPGDWKWSGYRFYALGEPNDLLDIHPTILGLSTSIEIRRRTFQDYVCTDLVGDEKRNPEFSDRKYIGSDAFGSRLDLSTG